MRRLAAVVLLLALGSPAMCETLTPAPAVTQLPPEIQVDRHLLRVERLLAADDPAGALAAMHEILALREAPDPVLRADLAAQWRRICDFSPRLFGFHRSVASIGRQVRKSRWAGRSCWPRSQRAGTDLGRREAYDLQAPRDSAACGVRQVLARPRHAALPSGNPWPRRRGSPRRSGGGS